MRVALTVPETRRLLSLAGGDAERQHHLRWSQWRRTHQATAKRCHTARRAQRQPPMHRQGHIIRVAGTPTLTEELWARLAPLLPPWQSSRGRPPGAHRPILAGLLWMMRAGVGWREIPTEFGAWQTLYSRYRLWCRDGTWGRIVAALPPTQQEGQLSL
jgi:transposase